jgi:hypothetical protein
MCKISEENLRKNNPQINKYIQVFKKCRTKIIVPCSEAFGR